jgi:hypothetical protein
MGIATRRRRREEASGGVGPVATLAWLSRVESHPVLAHVTAIADKVVRTPPGEQRALIASMGLSVTADTIATTTARRGPMTL